MRLARSRRVALLALATLACGPKVSLHIESDTDVDASTGDVLATSMGGADTTGPTADSSTGDVPIPPGPPNNNAIDVLLVIDNSGTMGDEQAQLAVAIGALAEILDNAGADWRLGITTTDNGNPWCRGTSPEGGQLVASSCRARTQDFVFHGAVMADATQAACLDACPEEWTSIELGVPWIESAGGTTNLPPGLSAAQALACMVPQGINGCGFEQHLESLRKAIVRSSTEGESSFGFLRPEASLGILVVTDEVDCSSNGNHDLIFLPDGNRVFWSDPDVGFPTSAVCWNAGVECTGAPGSYDECHSVDLDIHANAVSPANADVQAVLHPLVRYTEYLQELENAKRDFNPGVEVTLMAIAGVASDGTAIYQDSPADPTFQIDFGIGPGCQSAVGAAVPPVRLRELVEGFATGGGQAMHSICSDAYGPAIEAFGNRLASLLP